jgi:hypothetical protein
MTTESKLVFSILLIYIGIDKSKKLPKKAVLSITRVSWLTLGYASRIVCLKKIVVFTDTVPFFIPRRIRKQGMEMLSMCIAKKGSTLS